MNWTRSDVLGLAKQRCVKCEGIGFVVNRRYGAVLYPFQPCACVLRAIFTACHNSYVSNCTLDRFMSKPHLARLGDRGSLPPRVFWERLNEDYICDFHLVGLRTLVTEIERGVFRLHFLLGHAFRACCAALKITRGNFFHFVYLIQQRLGRAFAELQPYPLYPLHDYYTVRRRHAARTA